jgi:hypothetical protein
MNSLWIFFISESFQDEYEGLAPCSTERNFIVYLYRKRESIFIHGDKGVHK